MYTLIVTLFMTTQSGSVHMLKIDGFENQTRCEVAAQAWKDDVHRQAEDVAKVSAVCVKTQ